MMPQKNVIKFNDIMMYVAVLLRHLRLMVLLFCLSLSVGLFYYTYARPVYYSKCKVKVDMFDEPVSTDTIFRDSNKNALKAQLESVELTERTARRLGVVAPIKVLEKQFYKKKFIGFDSESNLIIEINPYSYEWARDWAEALIKEYLLARDEKRAEQLKINIAKDSATLVDMQRGLEDMFASRQDFAQSNNLLKVEIQLNQLKDVPAQLAVVHKRIAEMDRVRSSLTNLTDPVAKLSALSFLQQDSLFSPYKNALQISVGQQIQNEESGPVVVLPGDAGGPALKSWEKADREKRRLEREIAEKSATYLPGHREIQDRLKAIAQTNQWLEVEFQSAFHRFSLEYDALVEKERSLEAKVSDYDEANRLSSKLRQESQVFEAKQLNWVEIAKKAGQKLSQIDFGADKEKIELRYIGPVETISYKPISPTFDKVFLVSLVMGIGLAIGVPFLINFLDNSVSDIEQIEGSIRIQGLGVVPRVDEGSVRNLLVSGRDIKPAEKSEYHLQENFRVIRTNLIMHSPDPTLPQVILVTSAMPQEGKTMVAANLAMSFAAKGEKVLLVDGDLRRGRLHRLFGVPNKPGLSDVLSGYNLLGEVCRASGSDNLTLLPCGKHLNWASELLDNPGYARIIQELRGQYQRIIIDTPPVLGLCETSIMQRFSDGILLVVWSNRTQMTNIKDTISVLQSNGAKFLGFVVNCLDFNTFANRYKYFYYSPRYYTNYKAIEIAPASTAAEQS